MISYGDEWAKIIEVIEVRVKRGRGTSEDPYRFVTWYYFKSGTPLTKYDNWEGGNAPTLSDAVAAYVPFKENLGGGRD